MPASRDLDFLVRAMFQEYGDIAEYIINANNVRTRARTRYYKAAYYTSVQIAELLVYMIVLASCKKNPKLYGKFTIKSEKKVHELVAKNLGSTKKLHITETLQRASTHEDITKDFQTMIAFCKSQKLVNSSLGKRLDRIRAYQHCRNL